MRVLWVKLGRDMRAAWTRLALMVLALAVSLTAFGVVLLAWSAAGRETGAAYAGTEPASATIVLDQPIEAGRMAAVVAQAAARPGVITATSRTQFDSDVVVNGRPVDIPLQVFAAAPDDPMRVSTFDIDGRAWPPGSGEIFVTADSLALLGVSLGDTLTVDPPGGRALSLRVAATVYDPSLSPSPQEQRARAYVAWDGPFDQLKVQFAGPGGGTEPSRDRDAIVAAASELGQWLQREQGLAVREIQVPRPYAHPHQWQADALMAALLAGAAATLLLSAILAATMLGNLFTQHIPQIGVMKAIGARSGRLGRYYLIMILLIAMAATILALVPAIWLSRTAVEAALGLLGIRAASVGAPAWAYAVVAGLGVCLPPLLSLVPLVKASRTTVRAAIDHHGAAAVPGRLPLLGGATRLNRSLAMALRNTVRRPARFWLSTGLLATAGMVFVAGMSLSDGTDAVIAEKRQERTWDVEVLLARPAPVGDITRALTSVPGIDRIDALNVAPAGVAGPGRIPVTRTYPDQGHGRVAVTALPADAGAYAPPKMLEGRWLAAGETGTVVLNQIVRANTMPGARAGDTVQLIVAGKTTTWRVAGIAEETLHGAGVYTTAEGFAAAMGGPQRGNQLRVVTGAHDEQSRQAAAAAIGSALAAAGLDVKSAVSVSRADAVTAGHIGPIVLILLGIALPLGVVGVVGLASTMGANVLDRTREFGVMHAIGVRPKTVRRIVVAEGVILAVASYAIAALPALGLIAVLGNGLGGLFFDAPLPYRISVPAAILWLGIVVLGSMLATEAAATRASRMTVREAMAHYAS